MFTYSRIVTQCQFVLMILSFRNLSDKWKAFPQGFFFFFYCHLNIKWVFDVSSRPASTSLSLLTFSLMLCFPVRGIAGLWVLTLLIWCSAGSGFWYFSSSTAELIQKTCFSDVLTHSWDCSQSLPHCISLSAFLKKTLYSDQIFKPL